jgi:resuscitation-promoting factor RpfB
VRHRKKRAPLRYAVTGLAAIGLLGGGGVAYGMADHGVGRTVALTVDGQSRTVRTHASDVRGALRAAGLAVGAHDVVAPALDAAIHDGTRISLVHGRRLTLLVDGAQRTIWVTQQTIGQAIDALGLRTSGAYVSASRSGRIPLTGATVVVQLPKRVMLIADGRHRMVVTTAVTVADMLAEQGVTLSPRDRVSVGLDRVPSAGLVVQVSRVAVRSKHVVVRLAFGTRWVADSSLYKGVHRVLREGRAGRADRWYRLTYVDGRLAQRQLVRWHREPAQPQVIAYGTRSRPVVHTSYPSSSDGLNWAALARCESGGNPSIVDPPFYGLYQFMISTWESVGGHGLPSNASAAEQTYRAKLLYARDGRSPWPVCGAYL